MKKDYYKILEVHPEVSQEVMNKAYRTLVQKFHPDHYHVSNKSVMEERMREINEAYDVLSDPKRRERYNQHYDAVLSAGVQGSVRKQQLSNVIRWFLVGIILVFFLGSGLKLLLLNPLIRMVVFVCGVYFGLKYFVRPKNSID